MSELGVDQLRTSLSDLPADVPPQIELMSDRPELLEQLDSSPLPTFRTSSSYFPEPFERTFPLEGHSCSLPAASSHPTALKPLDATLTRKVGSGLLYNSTLAGEQRWGSLAPQSFCHTPPPLGALAAKDADLCRYRLRQRASWTEANLADPHLQPGWIETPSLEKMGQKTADTGAALATAAAPSGSAAAPSVTAAEFETPQPAQQRSGGCWAYARGWVYAVCCVLVLGCALGFYYGPLGPLPSTVQKAHWSNPLPEAARQAAEPLSKTLVAAAANRGCWSARGTLFNTQLERLGDYNGVDEVTTAVSQAKARSLLSNVRLADSGSTIQVWLLYTLPWALGWTDQMPVTLPEFCGEDARCVLVVSGSKLGALSDLLIAEEALTAAGFKKGWSGSWNPRAWYDLF